MRYATHYAHGRLSWLALVEICTVIASLIVAYWLQLQTFQSNLPLFTGLAYVCAMMLAMVGLGLYDSEQRPHFRETAQRILMAQVVTLLVMSMLFFLFRPLNVGRGLILLTAIFSTGAIMFIRSWAFRRHLLTIPKRRVVVIGSQKDADELHDVLMENDPRAANSIVGFVPFSQVIDRSDEPDEEELDQVVARLREMPQSNELVVATKQRRNSGMPMQFLLRSKLRGLPVDDVVSFCERELGLIKIDHLRISWLVFGSGFDQGAGRAIWKRIFDILVSLPLFVIALPFVALAALAIFMETGRPIFFRQVRTGAFGKPFEILKLRSMRIDAEKDGVARWAQKNDSRITPVGSFLRKTRIDELPQLINVLRGEMSFVGPRPERPIFTDQLSEDIPFYEIRHYVKPGLTGWAQVRLPYGDSVEGAKRKLEYDLYYVKNNSLFFDFLILMTTIRVVLRRKGQ